VIGKHRRAPITATVVKVSTGAIETLPLIEAGNLANALEQLKQAGYWIYGLDLNTDRTLDDIPKDVNVCLVLGNEGSGLSSLIKKRCDVLVTIPMYGQTNSLNVSVAAGMAMHHLSKAR
jgi:23S rRNA (guanosine2251-2'-O)-methyltransferase